MERAQLCYEAYQKSLKKWAVDNNKSEYWAPLAPWDSLPDQYKDAWRAVDRALQSLDHSSNHYGG